jgi:hypothetical protein
MNKPSIYWSIITPRADQVTHDASAIPGQPLRSRQEAGSQQQFVRFAAGSASSWPQTWRSPGPRPAPTRPGADVAPAPRTAVALCGQAGRAVAAVPEMPCSVLLEIEEWQALYGAIQHCPTPPESPPSLGQAMRWIAQLLVCRSLPPRPSGG